MRPLFLSTYRTAYKHIARPFIFRGSAAESHERALDMMRRWDANPGLLRTINRLSFKNQPVEAGGVALPHPMILAAGWVKGDGFASEGEAADAVNQGRNIIPGWRSMPALVGVVEFGSFTRWPRIGNSGIVLWRDAATRSTQNRIGLKNPGAEAAAEFLRLHKADPPDVYGINIAVSPGVTDRQQEEREVLEAISAFTRRGVIPDWFTLNLSCPNTEDDPRGNQAEDKARELCRVVVRELSGIPLWVKIGPTLSHVQVVGLMRAFAEVGVKAVIATNTLPQPTPEDANIIAGVAGGRLHQRAVEIACMAIQEVQRGDYPVDVIGCGGIEDGKTYQAFAQYGVKAGQYLSSMIYRGPLVGALIQQEALYG